jgi:hypothetical protein
MASACPTRSGLGGILDRGLAYLIEEQLPFGEIPNFRLLANGSWEYCFSPLPAAYVHDALSCFDPLSSWFDPQAIDQVNASSRTSFLRAVLRVRRKAFRFLAWQQSCDLGWRFYGLGSALPADADLTAMAGTALVEVRGRDRACDWSRQTACIRAFQCEDGLYGDPQSRGDRVPAASAAALRLIASANVLRYYALTGEPGGPLEQLLHREFRHCSLETGRVDFLWALARACKQGRLELLDTAQGLMVGQLLDCRSASGSFGGPLSTALATHALLDLEYEGPELRTGREALLSWLDPVYGRRYEGFGHNGCGSSAWTTIAIITALARGGSFADA